MAENSSSQPPHHEPVQTGSGPVPNGPDSTGPVPEDGPGATGSPLARATRRVIFGPPEGRDRAVVADALRTETVGGAVLLAAAVIAVVWANLPISDLYQSLRSYVPFTWVFGAGPVEFHLDLSLAKWAADGLLAIFFFIVGLELKREFLAGSLRKPAAAAVPVVAAVAGMAVPALFYAAITFTSGPDALRGWAIPAATDIAFALAVLAVVGSRLPAALRAFLLTLAVVDDLLAIIIIAVFYTSDLDLTFLVGALVPLAVFAVLVQKRITTPWLLIPLALITWLFVHESGVHATIAGVLLGFVVPVAREDDPTPCLASHLEHVWRPVSAGVAIPVYAFFAAGVNFVEGGIDEVLTDPVAIGVMAGLVLGKLVGISSATFVMAKFTRAELDENLGWQDVIGLSLLGGIGFTVSLLIGELSFGEESETGQHVTAAVLFGSVISAALAAVVLSRRNKTYRLIAERDEQAEVEKADASLVAREHAEETGPR